MLSWSVNCLVCDCSLVNFNIKVSICCAQCLTDGTQGVIWASASDILHAWKPIMPTCVIILFVPHNVQSAWCLSSWSSRPPCNSASCFWQKNGTSRRWEIFSLLYACCQSHGAYCVLCNNLYIQSTLITYVVPCGMLMQGAVFVRECSQSFNKQPQRPKGNM